LFISLVFSSFVEDTVEIHHDIGKEKSVKQVHLFLINNDHKNKIISVKWDHLTSADISLIFKMS